MPEFSRGNSPTDGGFLLLEKSEVSDLKLTTEQTNKFIRPFVGSNELINGFYRYCIWIDDENIDEASDIKTINERILRVKEFRLESKKKATVEAANWPYRFDERKPLASEPIICVPVTSSENREYLPVGLLQPGTAVSNSAFNMPSTDLWVLSLIASRMNLIWVATVCSRMEMRYRFTSTLAWNTFPIPDLTKKIRKI